MDKQNADWLFSVSDNGIGIKQDQLDNIFNIYHKANDDNNPESFGIGLSACHKIIRRHGGAIWVESEVGRGSTFYFTLKA